MLTPFAESNISKADYDYQVSKTHQKDIKFELKINKMTYFISDKKNDNFKNTIYQLAHTRATWTKHTVHLKTGQRNLFAFFLDNNFN